MMNDDLREQRRRRAAEFRAAFYASRPRPVSASLSSAQTDPVGSQSERDITRYARPCAGQNQGWIAKTRSKVLSLAIVVASESAPDAVANERTRRCGECPHCTVAKGKHYCGCCGCPAWNIGKVDSALEYKNGKAGWCCPRLEPAFGPWTEEDDGLTPPV